MINQLEFLFSNLKSISRDTAMLEMFDWNEENLEKFRQNRQKSYIAQIREIKRDYSRKICRR